MRFIDLTGERFHHLLVLKRDISQKYRLPHWICECDCGKILSIPAGQLKSVRRSCGCHRKKDPTLRTKLLNKTFGRLIVIGASPRPSFWKCRCECGNDLEVFESSLKNGSSKSCGCLRVERLSGENSIFWKGVEAQTIRGLRRLSKYVSWGKQIKKRDKVCQKCNTSQNLNAHHIINFIIDPYEKALDLSNGICLCKTCHKLFHKLFGKTNNNQKQIDIFLKI